LMGLKVLRRNTFEPAGNDERAESRPHHGDAAG
jgi:hypothetical protein